MATIKKKVSTPAKATTTVKKSTPAPAPAKKTTSTAVKGTVSAPKYNYFVNNPIGAKIANVGATLKSSLTLQGVRANTGNKTANTILSAGASNPYATALIFTPVIGAAKKTLSIGTATATRGTTAVKNILQQLGAPVIGAAGVVTGLVLGNVLG